MKGQVPTDPTWVVGLATEPLDGVCRSDDFVYLDVSQWTQEDAKETCKIQRETGILASPKITHVHESEYPVLRWTDGQPELPDLHASRRGHRAGGGIGFSVRA